MALPNLSDEDRQKALKKAAEARQKRAALRAEIKSGKLTFAAVMKKGDDPVVARMKVSTLLESLPGFGKAKASKIMTELEISQSRRVQAPALAQQLMTPGLVRCVDVVLQQARPAAHSCVETFHHLRPSGAGKERGQSY
jgi:hypothetical protein